MKNAVKLIFALLFCLALCSCSAGQKTVNRGDVQNGFESSGISLVERAYSYGDISLPNASSNPNNNVR